MHGDLEPRNLVRRPSGELAILDFTESIIGGPCQHIDQKVGCSLSFRAFTV